MDVPELTPDLAQRLDRLDADLPGCNPLDSNETAQLARQLMELRSLLEARGAESQVVLCDLAQKVVQIVSRHGVVGPREAMGLVDAMLKDLRASFGAAPARDEGDDLQRQLEALTGRGGENGTGLQLVDGRKLGEILVSLSMLTPADVERAVQRQKTSGMRFGEALIDLGLISREAIRSALNIQRRRRGSGWSDPWSERRKA